MFNAEDYHVETRELSGWKVNITSYKIGDWYHCHISNVDPGATIARTDGSTREEAMQVALAKAYERLTSKLR